MEPLARGSWGLAVLSEERKGTAKLHGPLLHQDITLVESVAFLCSCGTAVRWADSLILVHRYWTRGPIYSSRGQFIYASTWRRIWERIDENGTQLIQVEWVKGYATIQHVRAGRTSLWQLQENELADEQAKKGSALHRSVAQVEQSYSARTSFLGWLAKLLGRLSSLRKIQRLGRRGAQGAVVAARTAWEAGGVPTRTAKEESHTRQIFAHAHAGEDGQLLVLLQVRVLHHTTGERACGTVSRNRAKPGWSTPEAQG